MASPQSEAIRHLGRTVEGISRDVSQSRVQRGRERLGLSKQRQAKRQLEGELELKESSLEREVRLNSPDTYFNIVSGSKIPEHLKAGAMKILDQPDLIADPDGQKKMDAGKEYIKVGDNITTRKDFARSLISLRKLTAETGLKMDRATAKAKKESAKEATRIAEKDTKEATRLSEKAAKGEESLKKESRKSSASLRKDKKRRIQTLEKDLRNLKVDKAEAVAEVKGEEVVTAIQESMDTIETELKDLRKSPEEAIPSRVFGTRESRANQSKASGKDISGLSKFNTGKSI